MTAASSFYSSLAIFILFLQALFIAWVVFGALLTHLRPVLRWLHVGSLVWGVLTELLPGPCPLTLLENGSKARPEWTVPRRVPAPLLGQVGLSGYFYNLVNRLQEVICALNLVLYGRQMWIAWHR
jgi:Protein of Unknown function (DUF2784)